MSDGTTQEWTLLPCPFCGKEARLRAASRFWVECDNQHCQAKPSINFAHERSAAIAIWNTRAGISEHSGSSEHSALPDPAAEIAKLKVQYEACKRNLGEARKDHDAEIERLRRIIDNQAETCRLDTNQIHEQAQAISSLRAALANIGEDLELAKNAAIENGTERDAAEAKLQKMAEALKIAEFLWPYAEERADVLEDEGSPREAELARMRVAAFRDALSGLEVK